MSNPLIDAIGADVGKPKQPVIICGDFLEKESRRIMPWLLWVGGPLMIGALLVTALRYGFSWQSILLSSLLVRVGLWWRSQIFKKVACPWCGKALLEGSRARDGAVRLYCRKEHRLFETDAVYSKRNPHPHKRSR